MTESRQPGELYPEIEPYEVGHLKVDDLHDVYYEMSGNKDAKITAVIIHGGPGGGSRPFYRRFFDPETYRIVQMDQRGSGKSTPYAELKNNTTWHLVADLERLREKVGVDKWVVFGGSWGSTLSLAYAEKHPEHVMALVLRGIFTLRRSELLWYYQEGASHIFPDLWEGFLEPIPPAERGDMMSAYYRRLTGEDQDKREKAALAWATWEMSTSRLHWDPNYAAKGQDPKFAVAFARIECHYFVNAGFFEYDGQLIDQVEIVRKANIPGTIVQGRYDVVCPARTAWDLHRKWPEADFHMIGDAGHSVVEAGISKQLVIACDKYRSLAA